MRLYGLIGYPLSHSFSASWFATKFENEGIDDARYELFPIDRIDLLPRLIEDRKELKGLNVTIPYKEQVIPYLTGMDEAIRGLGAVNTIKIRRTASEIQLTGYNTDVYGFRISLEPLLEGKNIREALILGTGGASRAVKWVLDQLGIRTTFVSRNQRIPGSVSYNALTEEVIRNSTLIVNASPAGMYPAISVCPPIPYEYLTDQHVLYDLVYNPEETLFLKKGKSRGARTKNGLQMLHLQAVKSWEIWNTDL